MAFAAPEPGPRRCRRTSDGILCEPERPSINPPTRTSSPQWRPGTRTSSPRRTWTVMSHALTRPPSPRRTWTVISHALVLLSVVLHEHCRTWTRGRLVAEPGDPHVSYWVLYHNQLDERYSRSPLQDDPVSTKHGWSRTADGGWLWTLSSNDERCPKELAPGRPAC
jgi:hypothetical protein